MFSLFFLPSVMCGFFRSSWAIGESRTSRGGCLPLYLVVVDVLDELLQVALELREPGRAGERLVEAEGGDDDVGLLVLERVAVVVEMRLARPQGQFVGRIAQVVDHQLEVGEAGVQQRLEVPVILHPLGQSVADHDDPVTLSQLQLCGRG